MGHRHRSEHLRRALLCLLCLTLPINSCSERERYDAVYSIVCNAGELGCNGNAVGLCNDNGNGWENVRICEGHTPECAAGIGCVACQPGARRCQANSVLQCSENGERWEMVQTCTGETFCYRGACGSDCARAAVYRSYEGCEYVAVTLMNSQLPTDFIPALVIGNRNDEIATVTVSRGRSFSEQISVPPDSAATIELPWDLDLKNGNHRGESANFATAAYRVESSLPVTVYQFNPLEYARDHDCARDDPNPGDGQCFSYTNDASLLLPIPALSEHYIVMSRPNLGIRYQVVGQDQATYSFSPSVLAVVNPHETEVTVEVSLSAPIAAGVGVLDMEAGDVGTFTIAAGGVLQLAARSPESCTPDWEEPESVPCGAAMECVYGYCDLTERDLTGTEIVASAPVAVYGAHDCTFIPYNRWACDHLEEQLFPFETWGQNFVVNQAHRENEEPDVWRILSGGEDNVIRFTPESIHDRVTLGRGEHVEFEARGAFEIQAEGPILVGQFMVGQNYNFVPTDQELPPGDPAFALAVPVEQWRDSYNFLAPSSYEESFVNIIAPKEGFDSIVLDGESLAEEDWQLVGRSEYTTLRLRIEPGSHSIHSSESVLFAILIYGFGQYTSYMFPGGLNLDPITIW